jgi:hypothetical protein
MLLFGAALVFRACLVAARGVVVAWVVSCMDLVCVVWALLAISVCYLAMAPVSGYLVVFTRLDTVYAFPGFYSTGQGFSFATLLHSDAILLQVLVLLFSSPALCTYVR